MKKVCERRKKQTPPKTLQRRRDGNISQASFSDSAREGATGGKRGRHLGSEMSSAGRRGRTWTGTIPLGKLQEILKRQPNRLVRAGWLVSHPSKKIRFFGGRRQKSDVGPRGRIRGGGGRGGVSRSETGPPA